MAEIPVEHHDNHARGFLRRDISWGAIIAGVLIALATMLALSLLGAGLGLLTVEASLGSLQNLGIGAAIWYLLSKLVSLFIGGFSAARLSANLDRGRAWLHGAAVWALAALGSAWLASSAIGSAATGLGNAASAAASGVGNVAQAASAVIPEDVDLPNILDSDATLDALPPRLRRALREQALTAEQLKAETRAAFRDVISREEQQRLRGVAIATATDVVRSPDDALEDINAGIDRIFGQNGIISAEDRRELEATLTRRTGVSEEEARELVNRYEAEARQAAAQLREQAAELRAEAEAAAEQAVDAAGTAALLASLALLLGLIAAVLGAGAGRQDEPVAAQL